MSNDLTCSGNPGLVLTFASAVEAGAVLPNGITAQIMNGSVSVTFSAPVSLAAGTALLFQSQPNLPPNTPQGGAVLQNGNTFPTLPATGAVLGPAQVPALYYLASAIVSGVSGSLTQPYTGVNASATSVTSPPVQGTSKTYVRLGIMPVDSCDLEVTAHVTNGSSDFTLSGNVTLPYGTSLTFATDPQSTYVLAASIDDATAGVLTSPYRGTNSSATEVDNVSLVLTSEMNVSPVLIDSKGQREKLLVQPFDSYADDDFVLFLPPGPNVIWFVGQDSSPVALYGIPANELGG